MLVDTSVLINFLRNRQTEAVQKLYRAIEFEIPFGITSFIYQELLQGTKTEKQFNELKKYLDSLHLYMLQDLKESYSCSAKIFFECRRKGYKIGTIDCLIAQTALENDVALLSDDSDFDLIKKVIPTLKVY